MKPPILHFPFLALDGEHQCRVEFDWFGTERYYVDNELVLKQWSLLGKTAEFSANGIKIQVRSRIVNRHAVTEVLLDDKIAHENLLSEYNQELDAKLNKYRIGPGRKLTWTNWLGKVVIWAVLAVAFFTLFKWLGRNAA
jgi:hypothetical protein